MLFWKILSGVLFLSMTATTAVAVMLPVEPLWQEQASSAQDEQLAVAVRDLLQARCWSCHGPQRREAGLRLDERSLILSGADSGLTVVPGKPDASRLLQRVRSVLPDEQMPPEGERLGAAEQQLLTDWVRSGLPWPQAAPNSAASQHWAWQPISRTRVPPAAAPDSADWVRNEIDLFVLDRLNAAGIQPATPASRQTLIRRASLDLLGLLPTPEQVQQFVDDTSADAWPRVVDRLLQSPHFGERWGRHWLDLARYADSDGYEKDNARPDAWRYRDWVIDAINQDLPFDQFTIQQLAGDLLPHADPLQKLATAFHRQTLTNTEGGTDQEEFRVEACFDRTETTGQVWLGLTVGCARCHSHKYEQLTQREYYQLFSIFNNADESTAVVPAPTAEVQAWPALQQAFETRRSELEQELAAALNARSAAFPEWLGQQLDLLKQKRLPAEIPGEIRGILQIPPEQQTAQQQQTLQQFWVRQHPELKPLAARLDQHLKTQPAKPELTVRVLLQRAQTPRRTFVLHRGEFLNPLTELEVTPAAPAILPPLTPRQSGQAPDRLDFARWLVSPDNPLPPRVAVNHIWARLFGRGIVRTLGDFGVRGDAPTHPELLDWLAARFAGIAAAESSPISGAAQPWSRKQLIRLILLSATWQQSSVHRPDLHNADPDNRLLARQNRLRVEGEIVRDISLQAAGLLTSRVGGPSVFPPLPAGIAELSYAGNFKWVESQGADRYRRGMYTFFKRTSPHPSLTTFDCPDANLTCIERGVSNTPLQALVTLNNEVFSECAVSLADRLRQSGASTSEARIRQAFLWCLGRSATASELAELQQLLLDLQQLAVAEKVPAAEAESAAWRGLCRALLNLDEFITRE